MNRRLLFEIVKPADVDALWPQMAAPMQRACERCNSTLVAGELWQMCRSGHAFLMIIHDGEGIYSGQIWRFDAARFRCIMMYGHHMRLWIGLAQEVITRIAKENGAVALVAEGRDGWARVLKTKKNGRDYEVTI